MCNIAEVEALPAMFDAVQEYKPASLEITPFMKRVALSGDSHKILMRSDSCNGCQSLNHLTVGSGTPITVHSSLACLYANTDVSSSRFVNTGGSFGSCN
jgi:hypothetical protein